MITGIVIMNSVFQNNNFEYFFSKNRFFNIIVYTLAVKNNYRSDMNFEEIGLISPLLKALDREWFTEPTEIQEKVIPLANKWKDILWCAQTGSGKTLAFALPILQRLYNQRLEKWLVEGKQKRRIQSLVVVPTRELAIQIWEAFKPYCTNTNFKHTVIHGWVNDFHQIKAIEKWVDILIATPGRLEDLISQAVIKLSQVEILALDEADRMLDLGFLGDIKKILKRIPEGRQTFLFSATMPKAIRELARTVLHCPEEISVKAVSSAVDTVQQEVYHVKSSHRRKLLQYLVRRKDFSSLIVFVKTKDDAAYVLEYVKAAWVSGESMHKNKSQNARQKALKALKAWSIKVLVATDIASRWLDVHDLSCVINYNIPADPETYVHRIGRTARAGKDGTAISFCIDHDKDKFIAIEKLINKKVKIIEDKEYLDQIIPVWRILGYRNFDENWKEKYKKKTRKSTWKKKYYKKK